MAQIARMGMLFVPSCDGRSHCPQEFTPISALATGARVLAQALLILDDETE
jgi:N-carbamoyl-L-amino-acid hydrolase